MTIAKPKMFSLSVPSAVADAVRALLGSRETQNNAPMSQSKPNPQPAGPALDPIYQDRARYARLLEKELDREILTEVEREDTEMLNRVRSALYAE